MLSLRLCSSATHEPASRIRVVFQRHGTSTFKHLTRLPASPPRRLPVSGIAASARCLNRHALTIAKLANGRLKCIRVGVFYQLLMRRQMCHEDGPSLRVDRYAVFSLKHVPSITVGNTFQQIASPILRFLISSDFSPTPSPR